MPSNWFIDSPILLGLLLQDREDLPFEEDVICNAYQFRSWWRYLQHKSHQNPLKRFWIYERALNELPGSYKLWQHYLAEREASLEGLPLIHVYFEQLSNVYERALAYMHKMPRIWEMYLSFLMDCRLLITQTRRVFDRALASLPITQHDRIWKLFVEFIHLPFIPVETTMRIYRRFLKFDPDASEPYIDFLINVANQPDEAVHLIVKLLNSGSFMSNVGQTKYDLWIKLCELSSKHPDKMTLRVEPILRAACARFRNEVGRLWVLLAEYHVRLGNFEMAHDVFEEALKKVKTIRDFSVVWSAYTEFEYTLIVSHLEKNSANSMIKGSINALRGVKREEEKEGGGAGDHGLNESIKSEGAISSLISGFDIAPSSNSDELEFRLARYERLLARQPILISDLVLRHNCHNTLEWHKRISLFEDDPRRQLNEFTNALTTIDPLKATGKPHTIWTRFAHFWVKHNQPDSARRVFEKAVQAKFKKVEHLASVWMDYLEFEMLLADHAEGDGEEERKRIRDLILRPTSIPPNHKAIIKKFKAERRMKHIKNSSDDGSLGDQDEGLDSTHQIDGDTSFINSAASKHIDSDHFDSTKKPNKSFLSSSNNVHASIQNILFHQVKLWMLYADIEESYGTFESTRAVYEKILSLNIATPSIIINYAQWLEEQSHFELSYQVYEHGVEIFKFPNSLEIWILYLTKFVERYRGSKLERTRDLFEQALEKVTPPYAKLFYIIYAEFEERFGMARHTLHIYERALCNVPDQEKNIIFNIYVKKAGLFFGITRVRQIFEIAIQTVLDKDIRHYCLRYAKLEQRLGELDRTRAIYTYCAQFCDPRSDLEFWHLWREFEEAHGNVDTFKEMRRIRRSAMAQYNRTISSTMSQHLLKQAKALKLMQEGQSPAIEETITSNEITPLVQIPTNVEDPLSKVPVVTIASHDITTIEEHDDYEANPWYSSRSSNVLQEDKTLPPSVEILSNSHEELSKNRALDHGDSPVVSQPISSNHIYSSSTVPSISYSTSNNDEIVLDSDELFPNLVTKTTTLSLENSDSSFPPFGEIQKKKIPKEVFGGLVLQEDPKELQKPEDETTQVGAKDRLRKRKRNI